MKSESQQLLNTSSLAAAPQTSSVLNTLSTVTAAAPQTSSDLNSLSTVAAGMPMREILKRIA